MRYVPLRSCFLSFVPRGLAKTLKGKQSVRNEAIGILVCGEQMCHLEAGKTRYIRRIVGVVLDLDICLRKLKIYDNLLSILAEKCT